MSHIVDWATLGATKYLGTINAATIPYRTSGAKGLAIDVRKYFANMSTSSNRPMVFDEIRLDLDISLSETSVIHYLRFGIDGGQNNIVCRNMITLQDNGDVTCAVGDSSNAIIGMRLGSNTQAIIRPFGGTSRIPTLANDLTLVTITDNSSILFGSGNSRLNLNTLYRLSLTDNVMYVYQSDASQTLFNGTIKVYGVKYPTE